MQRGAVILALLIFLILSGQALAADASESIQTTAPIRVIGQTRRPLDKSEVTGTASEVDATIGAVSLEKVLQRNTSIQVRASGGEGVSTQFLVRGQDPGQSRFFLEGIPLTDAEFNVSRSYWLPLETIQTVEVYPAAVPATLGEDGLGGAVQMRLRDRSNAPWTLAGRGGSFGYLKASVRSATFANTPSSIFVSATRSEENFQYFDDNGTPLNPSDDGFRSREHNRFMRLSVFPRITLLKRDRHQLESWGILGLQHLEVPGSVRMPTQAEYRERWLLCAIQHRWEGADRFHTSDIYFRSTLEEMKIPAGGRLGLYPQGDTHAWSVGIQTKNESLGKNGIGLSTAIKWHQFERSALLRPVQRGDISTSVTGGVSVSESLSLHAALLGHHYQYRNDGKWGKDFFLLSLRLGGQWLVHPSIRIRAMGGRFYRSPTLNEIYGTSFGLAASPDLQPEYAWKFDGGMDWSRSFENSFVRRAGMSYSFHASTATNLVSFIQTAQDAKRAVNLASARIVGHEIKTEVVTSFGLRVEPALEWLQTENLSDVSYQYGKRLPYRPTFRGALTVELESGRWSAFYRTGLNGQFFTDLGNFQEIAPTEDHSLGFTWRSPGLGEWSIEASNLTDVLMNNTKSGAFTFSEVASGYLGYPVPGRRIYLSWKLDV